MTPELFTIVRRNEVEAMLHNARLTRDWPNGEQKRAEAARQVRMVMYRFALEQIKDEERRQILEILSPCCPDMFSMQPPIEHQQPASSALNHETSLPDVLGF